MDRAAPWQCAVRRRERRLAAYHADPDGHNYRRVRMALRARIRAKEAMIHRLEEALAPQDRRRA